MATTSTIFGSAAITNRDCRAVLDAVKVLASLDPSRGFDLDRICAQRQICHYVMATKDWRDGCSARLVGRPSSKRRYERNSDTMLAQQRAGPGGRWRARYRAPALTRPARAFSQKNRARNGRDREQGLPRGTEHPVRVARNKVGSVDTLRREA
jgi:hypothetical protein